MTTNLDFKSTYGKSESMKEIQDMNKKYDRQISQLQKNIASLENRVRLYENDTKSIREFFCEELNVPYTEGTSLEELQVRFKGQQRKREEEIQGLIAEHNRNWSETFQKLKLSLKENQMNINKCVEQFKTIDKSQSMTNATLPDVDSLKKDVENSISSYNNAFISLQQTTILQLQSDLNSKESLLKESNEKIRSLENIITNLEIVQKNEVIQPCDNNIYRSFHMDYFKICEMLKEKCLYISTLEKELESLKNNLSDVILNKRQQKEIIRNLQNQISMFNHQLTNAQATSPMATNTYDIPNNSQAQPIDLDSVTAPSPLDFSSLNDLIQENKRLKNEIKDITTDHIRIKNQYLHLSEEVETLRTSNAALSSSIEQYKKDNEELNSQLDGYVKTIEDHATTLLSIKTSLRLPDSHRKDTRNNYLVVDEPMKSHLNKSLLLANEINQFLFNKMQYYKSKFNTLLSSLPTATTNAKNNSTHNQAMNELVSNDSDDYNNHHYNLEYMKDVLLKFLSFASGSLDRLRLIPVMRALYNLNDKEVLVLNNGEPIPKQYDISLNKIDPDTAVDYNELQSIFREKK